MRPAVDQLARHHRVITFSLCDEHTSEFPFECDKGFDNYVAQIGAALDRAGLERAVIAGVSFGGLIASEFAARHPERTSGLVLVSALHASWQPDERQRRYLKAPTLMSPFFVASAPQRLRSEVRAALPAISQRLKFALTHGANVVFAPATPSRMARRIALARAHQFADPHQVTAPVLVLTGEPGLDLVVPVDVTRRYLAEFAGAEHVVLERTGHIGLVTRPDAFGGVLERFVNGGRIPA